MLEATFTYEVNKMYGAIILSAGIGSRMGLGYNKMLYEINHEPIVVHTLRKFLKDENCGQLILVVNPTEIDVMKDILIKANVSDLRLQIVGGGCERQYSVYNGLQLINHEVVLVHDGARPFVTQRMIDECYKQAMNGNPSIVAVPVKDTIKRVVDGVVVETLERSQMYAIQTPQASPTYLLKQAHEEAKKLEFLGTDEASLIERFTKATVKVVLGDYTNIKLTTPEDLLTANQLMKVNS